MNKWEDDWQRAARERDDLVAERDALTAENTRLREKYRLQTESRGTAELRVRALEATLRRVRHAVDSHVPPCELKDAIFEMIDQDLPAETSGEPK